MIVNMILIVIQFFFLFSWTYSLLVTPFFLWAIDKIGGKYDKKTITMVALIANTFLFFGVIYSITFIDKDNTVLWGIVTIIMVVISSWFLLNTETNEQQIKEPTTLRHFIHNAKGDAFKGKWGQRILKSKSGIYFLYIAILILNQLGELGVDIFSNSLYLQVNEYSLIILFAIKQAVEEYRKSVKK